ncbi:methyl-accepting chemotaxis protein [Nitrosomonas sp.]|uniref:methyl-accepting chemotaxis protein n=1 Tax=Nitrosomonas sp. TaxID=42353 RepID=UPI001DB4CE8C|nr:methyl-accepting chemotaxis protein [Nitrosomonas sp.]MCB1949917.1 MCP four helix bundle domain-containing protein [Nitrosomonas sp.]
MFKNMTVKSELMVAMGLLTLLLISVGGMGIYGLNLTNSSFKSVYEDRTVPLGDLGFILDRMQRIRLNTTLAAHARSPEVNQERIEMNELRDSQILPVWQKFLQVKSKPTTEEVLLIEAYIQQWKIFLESRERVMSFAAAMNYDAAIESLVTDMEPKYRTVFDTMIQLVELQQNVAGREFNASQTLYEYIFIITAAAFIIGALMAWVLVFWLLRNIDKPLQEAIAIANAVAKGDLSTQIDQRGTVNGFDRLINALREMNNNLVSLVGKVQLSTDQITTASDGITAGNSNLSRRTEEQASNLEETAASMEELTSTVKQNADNARQANQFAVGASEVAVKGGNVVGQVVQTMNTINESSNKIVEIISVIDGIAFQTNILALNAAVEAARAGEQGRGFAVVATEVRTLAQRSAAAAKEINELISNSVAKVEEGTRLVDETNITMNEIVTSVKRVTDIMNEISAASNEQSAGIEQINQAISKMDEITQKNAMLVEQSATAAESMNEQTRMLSKAVSVFKLAGDGPANILPMNRNNRTAKTEFPNYGSAPLKPLKVLAGHRSENFEEF